MSAQRSSPQGKDLHKSKDPLGNYHRSKLIAECGDDSTPGRVQTLHITGSAGASNKISGGKVLSSRNRLAGAVPRRSCALPQ